MLYFFTISAFVISALVASQIIPRILLISFKKGLFDKPDQRKVHGEEVPRLGGVSFFPTILLTFCCLMAFRLTLGYEVKATLTDCLVREFLMLACGMILLYLIGIADDLVGVRYRNKFFVQFVCALLIPLSGVWINDLYGIFWIHAIPAVVGIPLTVLACVLITNAINLIDGIDGLASGLSSAALLILGILFLTMELWAYSILAFATFGVLVPFFYYNVFGGSRKIFMGDTGSLTLGYVLSFLSLKFCMYNVDFMPYTPGAIMIVFGVLIVPICDAIRVALARVSKGGNPFKPDRTHIHHKCLDAGFSHKRAMGMLVLIALCFGALNFALVLFMNNNLVLLVDVLLWVGLNWRLNRARINQPVAMKVKLSKKKWAKQRSF